MKIEIDKMGNLHVDGRMKMCPFKVTEEHYAADLSEELPKNRELKWRASTPCGDWCALFKFDRKSETVSLCHAVYYSDYFITDERESNDKQE